jgi:hypothetical protein
MLGGAMGVTFVEVAVAHPSGPEAGETLDLPVDSGVIYSVVPAPVLERLGIIPPWRSRHSGARTAPRSYARVSPSSDTANELAVPTCAIP